MAQTTVYTVVWTFLMHVGRQNNKPPGGGAAIIMPGTTVIET